MKPNTTEHPEFYTKYIAHVKQDNILDALAETNKEAMRMIGSISSDKGDFAYAENKWTIKEVFLHCIDTERIFSTRALCFARGEKQKALSFDENIYATNSEAGLRSIESIAKELESVGAATMHLFSSFSEKSLNTIGQTPSGPSTVNAIGFAICGHTLHHLNIIKERYLK